MFSGEAGVKPETEVAMVPRTRADRNFMLEVDELIEC